MLPSNGVAAGAFFLFLFPFRRDCAGDRFVARNDLGVSQFQPDAGGINYQVMCEIVRHALILGEFGGGYNHQTACPSYPLR